MTLGAIKGSRYCLQEINLGKPSRDQCREFRARIAEAADRRLETEDKAVVSGLKSEVTLMRPESIVERREPGRKSEVFPEI